MSSVSLIFGRNACMATASRPKPVTASEPFSELPRGARMSHASSLTNRTPRYTPRPAQTVRNAPRIRSHHRALCDAATACEIAPARAAVMPVFLARSAGSSPESSVARPNALTRNSASGICHRKIRYARPPARRPPARRRSLSKAWTASRTVACCSRARSNSRRALVSSSAAERRARAIRPASLAACPSAPGAIGEPGSTTGSGEAGTGGNLGSGGGRLRLHDSSTRRQVIGPDDVRARRW